MDKKIKLTYLKDNFLVEIINPSKQQLLEAVKVIPPGSVFVVSGNQLISKLIGYFGLIMNWFQALRKGFKVLASHAGMYWGSGEHKTVESVAHGVIEGNFLYYLNSDYDNIYVWHNVNLTIPNMQAGKDWQYSQIGKKYDYSAFARFIFKGIKQDEEKYICTETVADTVKMMYLFFVSKSSYDIHPIDIIQYMKDQKAGWVNCFKYEKI